MTFFMINNYINYITIFQNENSEVSSIDLLVLQISLISGLIENSWILMSTPTFNLGQYVILVEVYEESPVLHICSWKREKYFNSLFRSL